MKNQLTRRDFFKRAGLYGGAAVALSSGAVSLSGCTSSMATGVSYLERLNLSSKPAMNYWLDVMLQTARDKAIPPPQAGRTFAMANIAGFLAVNGIENKYTTLYDIGEGPADLNDDASKDIAFGVAFSRAFAEGAQTSVLFDKYRFLAEYPDGDKKSRAIAWGEHVSDHIIKLRTRDGAQPSQSQHYLGRYPRRGDVLQWAPTGGFYGAEPGPEVPSFARGALPGFGYVKPFSIKSAAAYLPPPFPDVRSPEFLAMYERIRLLGAHNSPIRTPKQTMIAHFWEAGFRTITPPGQWQLLALQIIQDYNLPLIEQARLFAMMSIAQADSGIATWHSKYHHDILRPETAIRQRAKDLNAMGIAVTRDANWQSLVPTPNFPAYTSGHSGFSTASSIVLTHFLGRDDVTFSSEAMDTVNWPTQLDGARLTWHSLSDAAHEASISREYGGIHWEADHDVGLKLGADIGQWVAFNTFFRRA